MKKIFLKITTALLIAAVALATVGCDKIVKLEFAVSVYDTEAARQVDKTITFNMNENLAPKAVAAVKKLVGEGYFDDCIFYKQSSANGTTANVGNVLFFGGLARDGETITQKEPVAVPDADFEKNGTVGSNLTNVKGALGLWRTWNAWNDYKSGFKNSYSTMYMPTSSISAYNGYFCVFAKCASDDDLGVIDLILNLFEEEDYYTEYTCWYSANANHNLVSAEGTALQWFAGDDGSYLPDGVPVWNIAATEDYENGENLNAYKASDDASQRKTSKNTVYDPYTVTVINADRFSIKSVTISK